MFTKTKYKNIKKKNVIIVNATALDRGGALSILKQFIENISNSDFEWLIFVAPGLQLYNHNKNIRIEEISNVKSLHKRFFWDIFGLKKWLKKNKIEPIASLSLQNTGFRSKKNIPQYIYYHQPIPFYSYRWNPINKKERSLWFYKNIYPFFVKLFLNKETDVFVQLNYIKDGFSKYFNHPLNKIHVYHPSIKEIPKVSREIKGNNLNLFYPSSSVFYKNINVLKEAMKEITDTTCLYLTINESKDIHGIKYIGSISFTEVCKYYNSCDALVFPSYIETYGLPLLEAAMIGLPIIASDLPYAHEVLDGYEGVTYVKHNDPIEWQNAIKNLSKGKRYKPIDISNRPSWKELIDLIQNSIK